MQNVSAICSVTTLTVMSLERCSKIGSLRTITSVLSNVGTSCFVFIFITQFAAHSLQIKLDEVYPSSYYTTDIMDGYYAIIHPMKAKYVCTVSLAQKAIVMLWFMSFVLAIPILFIQIHDLVGERRKAYWCSKEYERPVLTLIYEVYMLVIILLIPSVIMLFTYICIIKEIWIVTSQRKALRSGVVFANNRTGNANGYHVPLSPEKRLIGKSVKSVKYSTEDDNTRKQVIKMLVSIIIIFIVCWAPILINNVLSSLNVIQPYHYGFLKPMRQAFFLMSYANSCVNPIVYGFMSRNFRETFHQSILLCFRGKNYVRKQWMRRQSSMYSRSTNAAYHYTQDDSLCDCTEDFEMMSVPYGSTRVIDM